MKLFAIVDEQKLYDALLRIAAEDLSKIPFVNADSINVLALSKKIEVMENRLNTVKQFISSSVSVSGNDAPASSVLTTEAVAVNEQAVNVSDLADNSLSLPGRAQDAVNSVDGSQAWNVVARRNRKRVLTAAQPKTTQGQIAQLKNSQQKIELFGTRQKLQNTGYGPPPQSVSVDGHPVEVTDKFIYLGSTVDSTGYSSTVIL